MSNLPTTSLKFIDIANAYNASGLGNVGTTNLKLSDFAGAVLTDGTVPSSGPFNTSMFYGKTFGCARLGTDCSWNTVKGILDQWRADVFDISGIGYTVYSMQLSSTGVSPTYPEWYRLQSTFLWTYSGNPWGSTGEVHNGGSGYMQINGGLILVIDSNGDVIWKINTVGDNGLGGVMYAYNSGGSQLDLSVEYINYNSGDFPFVDISDASASRPINGNSTGGTTIFNDWHNGKTGDTTQRVVDDFRNHLGGINGGASGLKWVFIHNKTSGATRYNGMYNTVGNLFSNPVGIWPSYSYPSGYP
jgi:hypothetical protein